ncbi:zinc-dependent metalloprotease [Portibacter lacus]|uniref:Glutaminyl-tRNA synthetase n=1 Tax=Portibacter lacus TaxID=1099794 RepID=A0AA37SSM4_9BACT|nr:zinc-dependent metalloprotease [Portibacter lacus]GLR17433.1 glutaminyl-tRNA synthetase [Portibacter lacus]
MTKLFKLVLLFFVLSLLPTQSQAQFWKKKKETPAKPAEKKDKDSKIKKYDEIIKDGAVTDTGLFTVHQVSDNYYFEIPFDLLEQEILVVSRISGFVKGLNFGGAGTKSKPQQVIRWQRKNDQLLLRTVSYNSVASEEDPIYQSVKNNNFEPIIMVFDIKAFNPDSTSAVIDIKSLFTTDVEMLAPVSPRQRKAFELGSLDGKRSMISSMKSYPENTEIRHILTFKGKKIPDNQVTGTMSVEMNQSFIKLPEIPWTPRKFDARVGYFSVGQIDYSSNNQRASSNRFITRWKLEPKDPAAYARGELVEPVKPIIYYIDPSTPHEWRPFIKQGVNDWQVAFEEAGFKNAIMAKDAPTKEEDPDWTPEDVRYSTIRYVSTDIQNAMGPHVHDPRTGEILESDIIWYHNVMNLLRNWFFIQTAAINPQARSINFKEDVMGRLIRFVAAHEVGHTLGLPHNMGSSVAYPVDSLRSPSFTKRMGTAPSIMDYARFNYIAQPEDGDVGLMPGIGPYDKWSIKWGYTYFPGKDAEASDAELNKWALEKAGQPIYRFGRQRGNPTDPSAQTEDLGDDSMLASEYGIKNLKRILPKLTEWTKEDGKDYAQLDELYGQVFGQFNRYMGHVTSNIGGVYEFQKTSDEDGAVYTPVDKEKQKRAMMFLNEQLFKTPTWMIDQDIISKTQESGIVDLITALQTRTLNRIFEGDRLLRIIDNETLNGDAAYGLDDLFSDAESGIFSNMNPDTYTRNLQRAFVDRMGDLIMEKNDKYKRSDINAMARGTLTKLKSKVSGQGNDQMNRYHFEDLKVRIDNILDPK